ncbi:MAG: tetratricopeptide repeat protein [Candidatus Poseidoniales archaeon]
MSDDIDESDLEDNQDDISQDEQDDSDILEDEAITNTIEEESEEDQIAREIEALLIEGEDASRNNDIKGALSSFNKAIALDPSCDMAWFNRGVLLEAQQDARGARQSFQICLDLNPDHAPATANMAILLERIGDLEGAYETAQRALSFFPGHPALLDVQTRCKDSGISIAVESMQPSIKPTQSYDEEEMQSVLEETGLENADDVLAEAVHHDDDDNQHLDIDELRSAATMVAARESISQTTTEEQTIEVIEEEHVEEIPEQNDEDELGKLLDEARQHFEQEDYKNTFKSLKPHLKTIAATNAEAWLMAGLSLSKLGHDTHAIASLTHALNLDQQSIEGWKTLGMLQRTAGNSTDAKRSFEQVVQLDSNNREALEVINQISRDAGQIEDYLNSLRSLASLGNEVSKNQLVQVLLDLADGESNILDNTQGLPPTLPAGPEMAAEALSIMGEDTSTTRARGLSLANDHVASITMWKALIQADNNADHWTGLARSLERAGELEKAEKCHAKARSLTQPQDNIIEHEAHIQQEEPPQEYDEPVQHVDAMQNEFLLQPIEPMPVEAEPEYVTQETLNANAILQTPIEPRPVRVVEENPLVDLAKAALDATEASQRVQTISSQSSSIANHDIQWYNQGILLLEDQKYREALSSFDKALSSFKDDEDMIIRILNGRGNAYYFLEEFPKCIESYHQAMMIRPTEVRGQTLYNMGAAYASMERYNDAIKCFKQAIPRGLDESSQVVAKDQIRRCEILKKQQLKKKR